ncbi:hypothetical protein NE237_013756 [Protea cynaroides]|uniref:Aluminum-activated malate transporter n=1 Tax=Protea cynaroides TaxID=273540 RepID=A0A9Q0K0G2_9MAGN|nr:hypothetical protein NE237_013756 [Protea cynaroides]
MKPSTEEAIPIEDGDASPEKNNGIVSRLSSLDLLHCLRELKGAPDQYRLIHSIKVGLALVLVSLLYLFGTLFKRVGDNDIWAIMTVVIVSELYAGATIGKALYRVIGTIVGGTLGCLAAILARQFGKTGKATCIGVFVFIFGAAATYIRMLPRIKKRYDYGVMILILTFNLVLVSGVRDDYVIELAFDRLTTIAIGSVICVSTSLLFFPICARNELHSSTASKFSKLACSIEGCLEEYFKGIEEKEDNHLETISNACKSVIHSKSTDESLPTPVLRRQSIKEPCEAVFSLLACKLRKLGESIINVKRCSPAVSTEALQLQLSRLEEAVLPYLHEDDAFAMTGFVYLLMGMLDMVEILAGEVEELAGFATEELAHATEAPLAFPEIHSIVQLSSLPSNELGCIGVCTDHPSPSDELAHATEASLEREKETPSARAVEMSFKPPAEVAEDRV